MEEDKVEVGGNDDDSEGKREGLAGTISRRKEESGVCTQHCNAECRAAKDCWRKKVVNC
jgi:hypothetical protein